MIERTITSGREVPYDFDAMTKRNPTIIIIKGLPNGDR